MIEVRPTDYVRLFEFKNYPLFHDTLWLVFWKKHHTICINVDNLRTCYIPRSIYDAMLEEGKKFYGDAQSIATYRKEFDKVEVELLTISQQLTENTQLLPLFKEMIGTWFRYYSYTDFNYTDHAQKEIESNFPDFGAYKEGKRAAINKIAVGEASYIMQFLRRYARERNIAFSDIQLYTVDEIIQNKTVDVSQRKDSVLYYKDNELQIVTTREACNIAGVFRTIAVKRGATGNKGCIKGRAFVFHNDLSYTTQLNKLIHQMSQGDIFITETTSPELIFFCKKAGAIVTNQGGIMSHAAIVSRELGIPCIVGAENATHYFKTGDFVEVDADKGIVTIIKRASA